MLGVQSFVDGHLGFFHLLAVVSSAAMNAPVQVLVQTSDLIALVG